MGSHRVTRLLTDALAYLANRLAQIIKSCFRSLSSKETRPFRDYFNFSWKRSLPSQATDWQKSEQVFDSRYSGNNVLHVARRKVQAAQQFLKEVASDYSEEDKQALTTLVAFRRNLLEMTYLFRKPQRKMLHARTKEVERSFQKQCDTLSASYSPGVVHVKSHEGDYTCFAFPGGHSKHYMTFEVQYHPASGDYFFIIHNRGDGSSDKLLHGALAITSPDGTSYKRTSVKLKVFLEQLKNPELSGNLYKEMWTTKDTGEIYKIIKKSLLKRDPDTKRPLNIIASHQEEKWIRNLDKLEKCNKVIDKYAEAEKLTVKERERLTRAKSQKRHLKHRIKSLEAFLVSRDPAFHSLQSFGTCTESNSSSPEKSIASAAVRRELKLFTIDQLANEISNLAFLNRKQKRHRAWALQHYRERADQLLQKIKAA